VHLKVKALQDGNKSYMGNFIENNQLDFLI
jgi:signal transduction histidine kinase